MITIDQIYEIYGSKPYFDPAFVDALNASMEKYLITDPGEQAALLGMLLGESQCFTHLSENMNYSSASRIWLVFRSQFHTVDECASYVHNPVGLASHVYANRYGNGDEASQDGWNYRGKGPSQITFKGTYLNYFAQAGLPDDTDPDYLLTPEGGCDSACWFWLTKNAGNAYRSGGFDAVYARYQPSMFGLADHKKYYTKALQLLS